MQRFEEISHRFDVITVHNERDYRRVLTMPRKPNAKVLILPHGCCPPAAERFEPPKRSDPVIAYHGFLSPHKGLKELIQGFARFLRFYPRSRLLVVATLNAFNDIGGQLCLDECRQRVGELGLMKRVTFITEFLPMDDIIALLHEEADLIVLPYVVSGDSGSSGALRIAMASGKPVLASDIPLFYDIGEEVVKWRVEQLPHLADRMRDVWENQKVQQRVVERALQRVRSEPWTQAAKQLLAVYEGEEASPNTLSLNTATFAHSSAVR